ncbi:MAG TPA: hypothetical protein VEL31_11990 [Ktedonobacteraceae bacterium]|nr:hypothetical protein [Ktedonobacteraceae bacterium]
MQNITQIDEQFNDSNGIRTKYSYALKVQPCDLYEMDREQLLQVTLEYLQLVAILLNFIYNAKAEATTRLAAADLFITSVRRTARRAMDTVTAVMPVVLEKDIPGSVSKKLGFHRNTVSKAYQALEIHGGIQRTYEGEIGGNQHLRVAIQPDFLREDFAVEDKKERVRLVSAEEALQPQEEEAPAAISTQTQCSCCGSNELYVVCRPCGHLEPLSDPMDAEDLQRPHSHFTFDFRLVTQHVQQEYQREEPVAPDRSTALHHDEIEPTLNEVATQFHQKQSSVQFVPIYPQKENTLTIDKCGHDHGPAPSSVCWGCQHKTWSWNHLKDCWMCNWCYALLGSEVSS